MNGAPKGPVSDPRGYPDAPRIGVGVIVRKGGKVLLIKRSKAPRSGQWSLPGGRQELGETVRETARREVREEAGIEVAVDALVDVIDSLTRDAAGRVEYHYTLVDFSADWVAGELAAGSDAADAVWADPADLAPYDLWDETVRVIGLCFADSI